MTGMGPNTTAAMVVAVAALSTVAMGAGDEAALKLRMQSTPAGQTLTLDLQRWSTDGERAPFLSALTAAPSGDTGGRGTAGRGGTGAPARGRGAAPAPAVGREDGAGDIGTVEAPSAAAPPPPGAARGGAGRGGAAGARGGRGRGAGPSLSPESRLAAAVKAAPTLGFVWGMGVTGYSVKYAWRSSTSGRPERLVLITDRRLDIPTASAGPAATVPPAGSPADAAPDFTVLEIRFDAKGPGAGKTSLTTSATVDQTAGTIAVQNYDALPLQLRITP